jgi:hypothetical protein
MELDLKLALDPLGIPVTWGAFDVAEGLPCITLQQISGNGSYSLTGRASIETARVQVNVYAETYFDATNKANEVEAALHALRNSGSIVRCYKMSRRGSPLETGGDVVQLIQLDFRVRHRT